MGSIFNSSFFAILTSFLPISLAASSLRYPGSIPSNSVRLIPSIICIKSLEMRVYVYLLLFAAIISSSADLHLLIASRSFDPIPSPPCGNSSISSDERFRRAYLTKLNRFSSILSRIAADLWFM